MEKELRKQQNLLVDAGTGVILFAVWSVVKVNLYLGLSLFPMEQLYEVAAEVGLSEKFFLAFLVTILVGILLWQFGIRLYIGLSAAAEGKGKNKSWMYLVVAALLLITELQFNWETFGVDRILAGEGLTANQIIGICMEIASAYVLLELLISGTRVKILRKKRKE